MFIDKAKIHVKAGDGGRGACSFRHEKFVEFGGPDGGDGGKGGDIRIKGNKHMKSLYDFKFNKRFFAQNGEMGRGTNCFGKNGKNIVINLPIGTELKYFDITKNQEVIIDIKDESEFILFSGGKGGIGNNKLKTSIDKAPRRVIESELGQEAEIQLKLKLIGDVAIIGLPNAGKSSFLNKISRANSKVGSYAFTTLYPKLGSYKDLIFVDIPGIIEGASSGKGLGLEFLSHAEKSKLFLMIIDIADNPIQTYNILLNELNNYGMKKEIILCFNKCELLTKKEQKSIRDKFPDAYYISLIKPCRIINRLMNEIEVKIKIFK